MNYFKCPHRTRQPEIKDFWTDAHRCTYCGAINPEKFIDAIMKGKEIVFGSKTKKFYLDDIEFDHEHCTDEQFKEVKNFYESNLMRIVTESI